MGKTSRMSILGERLSVAARISRTKNNALKVDLQTQDGELAAEARQKGGAAVYSGSRTAARAIRPSTPRECTWTLLWRPQRR
jgi:hypothetical protein